MTNSRCVVYVRVSTSKQEEDGTSLETQLTKCEAYAADQGWEVVATFRESASGDDLFTRTEFRKALALITKGEADILLGYSLDRISRNQNHRGYILSELAEVGATLKSVTEKLDDSLEGELVGSVHSYVAAKERHKILERTYRGKRARAELKGKLIPGRKPPFGLLWGDAEKTHLIPDPATAPTLVRMFTMVADGGSATGVAKAFTAEGIPTAMGLHVPWRQTTITKILRNPIYTGHAEAFRHKRTKGKGRKRDGSLGKVSKLAFTPDAERVAFPEGTAPVLIPPATFAAVQHQLSVNKSQAIRNNRNPESFLLRAGFATCGYCGGTLIGRWNTRTGKDTETPFYECNVSNRTAHGCPHSRTSAKVLDAEVEARLLMVLEDTDFFRQEIEPQLRESKLPIQVAEVEKAIAERTKQISRHLSQLEFLDGLAAAEVGTRINTLDKEREGLQAQLFELKAAKAADDGRKSDLDKLLRTLEIAQRHSDELTYEQKRKWLTKLGFSVKVWAKDHAPRWEITSIIDPSFWEPDLEEWNSPWPEAEAVAGRIQERIVVSTSRRCSRAAGSNARTGSRTGRRCAGIP